MKKAHLQLKFDTTLLVIFNVIFIAPTHTQYIPPTFTLPPVNTCFSSSTPVGPINERVYWLLPGQGPYQKNIVRPLLSWYKKLLKKDTHINNGSSGVTS